MSELTPVTRIEEYLDAIVDGGTPPLEDVTRVETFLDCIYNNTVCPLTPVTRIEMFLGKISGQDIELPEPVTRVEQYLAAIAGEDVEIPDEPVTRIEEWLAEWANGGSPEYATVTGAIASFVTLRAAPLKELIVNVDPVQDLHGYANPWPGGGGANSLDMSNASSYGTTYGLEATVSGDVITISGTYSGTATTASFRALQGLTNDGQSLKTFKLEGENNIDKFRWDGTAGRLIVDLKNLVQNTSYSLKAQVMGYTGTAPDTYSPYSNICPISGWTGANVTRTGKNILSPTLYSGGTYNPTVGSKFNLSVSPTQLTDNGNGTFTITTSSTWRYYTLIAPIINGEKYYRKISWSSTGQFGISIGYLQKDGTVNSTYNNTSASSSFSGTLEPANPTNAYYYIILSNRGTESCTITITEPQIEFGTTETAYEPYAGNTYSADWTDAAGTVYSGTLTINEDGSGSVKARPYYASYNGETLVGPWVSSMDKYVSGATPTTGAQVVDLGGTETSTNLTPGQVTALLGQNYVWADTGDVSVTYYYPGTTASPIVGVGTVNNMVI